MHALHWNGHRLHPDTTYPTPQADTRTAGAFSRHLLDGFANLSRLYGLSRRAGA